MFLRDLPHWATSWHSCCRSLDPNTNVLNSCHTNPPPSSDWTETQELWTTRFDLLRLLGDGGLSSVQQKIPLWSQKDLPGQQQEVHFLVETDDASYCVSSGCLTSEADTLSELIGFLDKRSINKTLASRWRTNLPMIRLIPAHRLAQLAKDQMHLILLCLRPVVFADFGRC